ncbi:MAG TPA: hypothetical protein DDY13_00575 [Cytophagales bacterium]|jgi:hypothetical protein|nr:hypothetical protein [Cytophagales bacterium]
MIRSLLIFFIISTAFQGPFARAQIRTPKYSNEFLAIGVGARAFGMGHAMTSISNGVSSTYWNPAGLLDIEEKYAASLMHASWFGGIANYDYAGFATPIDSNSHLGISLVRMGVDDIPDTRFLYDANGALNYDNIRFFSAADYAFFISYARKIPSIPKLRLGGNIKVIYRNVGNFANAWGFGLDVSAIYKTNGWNFALMLRDVSGTFNVWTHNSSLLADIYAQTDNVIPETSIELTLPKTILGVSKSWRFAEKYGVLLAMDAILTFDGKRNTLLPSDFASVDPSFGLELDYLEKGFVRFGLGDFQEIKKLGGGTEMTMQPNFGIGVAFKNVRIDYALTNVGELSESLYSHIFSINLGFN